ncbi:PREDICTED: zeatin O-glucosyltransferase-like [Ipomoea nil]|uniref:zeatin O-glucosyltransferase-like n=1 Tax=Ipomoea nil TaxID=35883 RepID=UPI0009012F1E|nr:PREDICTED: zeatin O-glucosyltransferase-like [Ipomoea nil]XP_019162471.1 PREDICTED: zeatin O-glucosyltransferase-like [Ipomoea nil]
MPNGSSILENGTKGGADVGVVVVMLPLPAQGHLNQFLHLSRLIAAHGIPVHYAGAATHIRQATHRVHGWDPLAVPNLHFHHLSMPHFQSPPPNPDASTKFPTQLMPVFFATSHLRRPFNALIRNLSVDQKRVVVISDSLMGWVVQDVPSLQNAELYRFRCISAFTTYSFHWERTGKPDVGPEAAGVLNHMPSPEGCFIPEFEEFIKMQRPFWDASSGDLLNSCREIEALFIDLIGKESKTGFQWAIGPLNPVSLTDSINTNRHKSLEWLDRQEKDSVLFVSFGSTTSLSNEQITELGAGLEESGQKFIWVVRDGDRGDVFDDGEAARRAEVPEGYEERVRGRGVVVREWAPQLEILGHPSVGGFMSHCGWNSCMESISMGVPIAAWPMHSDQPRNATLITEVLKMGISLVDWARRNERVGRREIGEGVKKLIASAEGEEMRRRAAELSQSLKEPIAVGGGGRNELESFVAHITR